MKTGTIVRLIFSLITALGLMSATVSAGGAAGAAEPAMSSTIVISQIYGGGAGEASTFSDDYVELFNRGTESISLDGWSVQSAAVGSDAWIVTPLNGTLAAGRYFLVQMGDHDGPSNLPAPDARGAAPLSADGGKITLVRNVTPIAERCPAEAADLVDLVGYGEASCAEGTATSRTGASEALIRLGAGCMESDHNANDFTIGTPTPRNRAAPAEDCRGPIVLVSFTAENERDYIDIRWETSFEDETRGFNLYRGTDTSQGTIRINPSEIPAHGGTGQINRYSHPDYDVDRDVTYHYFLEEVSLTGNRTVIGIQQILREVPSAVTVQSFETGSTPAPGGAILLLAGSLLALGWVWRRAAR